MYKLSNFLLIFGLLLIFGRHTVNTQGFDFDDDRIGFDGAINTPNRTPGPGVRPGGWNNNNNNINDGFVTGDFGNQQQQPVTPVPSSGVGTTVSPQFFTCMNNCLTTTEYNPVCGSDNNSYTNERRLGCANQCNRRFTRNFQDITVASPGTCRPPTAAGQRK